MGKVSDDIYNVLKKYTKPMAYTRSDQGNTDEFRTTPTWY